MKKCPNNRAHFLHVHNPTGWITRVAVNHKARKQARAERRKYPAANVVIPGEKLPGDKIV